MRRSKLLLSAGAALVLALIVFLALSRRPVPLPAVPSSAAVTSPRPVAPTSPPPPGIAPGAPAPADPSAGEGESSLAADLNAPGGTIQRDLAILQEVFTAWLTNFPRLGHPGGENRDITAALCGENPVRFAFIPRTHRAINAAGELCDRWGTPFRFHQLSGQHMELRSAGPDRRFGTPDDAVLTPEGAPVL